MKSVVRAGLAGCGAMGSQHLALLREMSDVEIAGVFDRREESARRMAREFSVPCWVDYDQFLSESGIEALHICSPTGNHATQGIAAAQRGIHVLCEKPVDIDLEKVDRLIRTCRQCGVVFGCILQRRAILAPQMVQRAIAEGRMGKIISCSVSIKWWRSQEYYDQGDWRGTWRLDGGALANQGIHSLDQMVWMAGPVEAVEYAHLDTANHSIEAEDFAIAVVRFESGARGTIEATTCCRPDFATRLEIYGTRGAAAFEDARVSRFGLDGVDMMDTLPDPGVLTGGGAEPMAIDLAGHRAQIVDFYQAVRQGCQPMVSGHDARSAIDLLSKIYQFARPGIKLGT